MSTVIATDRWAWVDPFSRMATVVLLCVITYRVGEIESKMGPAPVTPVPTPGPSPGPTPNPLPVPVPQTQLAKAGQAYHFGASAEYANLRDQIKSGSIKTAQQVADFMASAAKPFGDQIKITVASNSDSKGNITNPNTLASEFDALSKAVEAK